VTLALVVAIAVTATAATVIFTRNPGSAPLVAIEPDSIGIVDPGENALVAHIPLHTKPAAIAYGAGALWVATERDETLLKIDPDTRRIERTIGLGAAPTALVIGGRNVWVLSGSAQTLFQFNGHTGQLVRRVAIGGMTEVGPYRGNRYRPCNRRYRMRSCLPLVRVALGSVTKAASSRASMLRRERSSRFPPAQREVLRMARAPSDQSPVSPGRSPVSASAT
jgi:DNA-binding beta-propeller fold protein YncE